MMVEKYTRSTYHGTSVSKGVTQENVLTTHIFPKDRTSKSPQVPKPIQAPELNSLRPQEETLSDSCPTAVEHFRRLLPLQALTCRVKGV